MASEQQDDVKPTLELGLVDEGSSKPDSVDGATSNEQSVEPVGHMPHASVPVSDEKERAGTSPPRLTKPQEEYMLSLIHDQLDPTSDEGESEAEVLRKPKGESEDGNPVGAEADADADDDDDEDDDDPLYELIDVVEKSMDYNGQHGPNGEDLVVIPEQEEKEIQAALFTDGPLMFLAKYRLTEPQPYTVPELLSALGFRIPVSAVDKHSLQNFEMVLQIAIRHVLKNRRRLPSPRTLDEIVELIKNANNIVMVTGAGISTSLGIPDFRSDNGLYAQVAHMGLSDPQEVFDIRVFREDPSIFYSVAAKVLPEERRFSPTHKFIKMLSDRGKLLRNYTQNIDNLEEAAGVPADKLVQCHGSFGMAHCFTCHYEMGGEMLFDQIKAGDIPRCPKCWPSGSTGKRKRREAGPSDDDDDDENDDPSFGVMKPDITFFGENLPARFDEMLVKQDDAHKLDLLLCMGTSLKVAPVSEIVKIVERDVPQVYVSKTTAKHCTFEVTFLGACDDVVELLCQKLGWEFDHPMARRPPNMPDTEYPGGIIEDNGDGVYTFESLQANKAKSILPEGGEPLEEAGEQEASEAPGLVSVAATSLV